MVFKKSRRGKTMIHLQCINCIKDRGHAKLWHKEFNRPYPQQNNHLTAESYMKQLFKIINIVLMT